MSPEAYEVLAAGAFPEARIAYYETIAAETELELLARELEEAEADLCWRTAGRRYARALGLPETLAPLVAIMVLSPDREHRGRAADVICRAVRRGRAA